MVAIKLPLHFEGNLNNHKWPESLIISVFEECNFILKSSSLFNCFSNSTVQEQVIGKSMTSNAKLSQYFINKLTFLPSIKIYSKSNFACTRFSTWIHRNNTCFSLRISSDKTKQSTHYTSMCQLLEPRQESSVFVGSSDDFLFTKLLMLPFSWFVIIFFLETFYIKRNSKVDWVVMRS